MAQAPRARRVDDRALQVCERCGSRGDVYEMLCQRCLAVVKRHELPVEGLQRSGYQDPAVERLDNPPWHRPGVGLQWPAHP